MPKNKAAAMLAKSEADWRVEDDMRTLARAAEIRKDPKRLAAAQKLAKEKLLELAAVAGGSDGDADD
jgi:hypothetical protein